MKSHGLQKKLARTAKIEDILNKKKVCRYVRNQY